MNNSSSLTNNLLLYPGQQHPVLLLPGTGSHQIARAEPCDCLIQAVTHQAGQEPGLELWVGVEIVQQLSLSLQ